MAFAERDGVKLAYESKSGAEPGLLFVHGWSCNRSYFEPQYEHFGRSRAVVAMDVRGHGESDQAPSGYDMENLADDAMAVAAAAGVERPIVVGHSMGGVIALALAARKDVARAAVLVDPPPIVFDEPVRTFFATSAAQFAADADGSLRAGFVQGMFLPTDRARRDEIVAGMPTLPPAIAGACIEALGAIDGAGLLSRTEVPVLSIGAASPSNSAADLKAHCPTITVGQTVGSGHFNQLEVPDQVNAMIERFLLVNDL